MDMNINKTIVIVVAALILLTSLTVIAKPDTAPGQLKEKNKKEKGSKEQNLEAPGQWKKTNEYENQKEFVFDVHIRIWERLQLMGVTPPGLERLLGFSDDGSREEPIEEPIEDPIEEPIEPPMLPVEGEPMD